jgi:hypothetical protein
MKKHRRKFKEHRKLRMNEDKKNYTGRITLVMLNTQEGRKLENKCISLYK